MNRGIGIDRQGDPDFRRSKRNWRGDRAGGGAGAIPAVVDRDQNACEKLKAELVSQNAKFAFIAADLADADNCRKSVDAIVDKFERLDALVNNAGINNQ